MPYSEVSISGYNANPPEDDGTEATSNEISWQKHLDKIGGPLKTAIETTQTNVTTAIAALEALLPAGIIWPYGGTSAPAGFLLCYGQAIDRTTYGDLFTAIGTTYGSGDGSTTFNVPDLRGRVIAGQDDMGGSSANRLTGVSGSVNGDTLGGVGGAETHTLTEAELAAHDHAAGQLTGSVGTTITNGTGVTRGVSTSTQSVASGGGETVLDDADSTFTSTLSLASGTVTFGGDTGDAGSGSAHNNVQPTIILNYIIKT
jgi:microcystin-dependent protein